jgi:hypothetical protein
MMRKDHVRFGGGQGEKEPSYLARCLPYYNAFSTTTTSTRSVPCSSNPTRLAAASERSMMRRFPAP